MKVISNFDCIASAFGMQNGYNSQILQLYTKIA